MYTIQIHLECVQPRNHILCFPCFQGPTMFHMETPESPTQHWYQECLDLWCLQCILVPPSLLWSPNTQAEHQWLPLIPEGFCAHVLVSHSCCVIKCLIQIPQWPTGVVMLVPFLSLCSPAGSHFQDMWHKTRLLSRFPCQLSLCVCTPFLSSLWAEQVSAPALPMGSGTHMDKLWKLTPVGAPEPCVLSRCLYPVCQQSPAGVGMAGPSCSPEAGRAGSPQAWQELLISPQEGTPEKFFSRQLLCQFLSLSCWSKSNNPHVTQHCSETLLNHIIFQFKVVCSKLPLNHTDCVVLQIPLRPRTSRWILLRAFPALRAAESSGI